MSASGSESLSEAVQHYMRAIYQLEDRGTRATTTAVAEVMHVSRASASVMLRRLAELRLVDHVPYRGVALTKKGRRVALEVIRHHRLLEQYLAETLGVPLDQLHEEADRLEHALSEELEQRIDALLGHPTHDPHGHPIPGPDLNLKRADHRTLLDLEPGERAVVAHVPDDEADLLRYLAEIGLVPGEPVQLRERAPFGGPLTLVAGGKISAISCQIAGSVGVLQAAA